MTNKNNLEAAEEIEKKFLQQDQTKKRKMKVSGKSVFQIKRMKDKEVGSRK